MKEILEEGYKDVVRTSLDYIKDNIKCIEAELEKSHSYKYYMNEKATHISYEIGALKRMFEVQND